MTPQLVWGASDSQLVYPFERVQPAILGMRVDESGSDRSPARNVRLAFGTGIECTVRSNQILIATHWLLSNDDAFDTRSRVTSEPVAFVRFLVFTRTLLSTQWLIIHSVGRNYRTVA